MAGKKDVKKPVPAEAEAVAGQKNQDEAPDGTAAGMGQQKSGDAPAPAFAGVNSSPRKRGAGVKSTKTAALSRNQWIIIAIVVVICAGTGYGLGRLFARSDRKWKTEDRRQKTEVLSSVVCPLTSDPDAVDSQGSWYYDFDPIVANLNEPSATRYIRAVLTLQISSELDPKKASAFLEEKKPLLKNWLTIYLANQTIDDIRGDRNLRRIQSEILDAFNEKLFPDSKPKIRNVLFKEFAIQ